MTPKEKFDEVRIALKNKCDGDAMESYKPFIPAPPNPQAQEEEDKLLLAAKAAMREEPC